MNRIQVELLAIQVELKSVLMVPVLRNIQKLLPLSLRHVFRSACFSKILYFGFCENKKADAISTFTKVQIHRLNLLT